MQSHMCSVAMGWVACSDGRRGKHVNDPAPTKPRPPGTPHPALFARSSGNHTSQCKRVALVPYIRSATCRCTPCSAACCRTERVCVQFGAKDADNGRHPSIGWLSVLDPSICRPADSCLEQLWLPLHAQWLLLPKLPCGIHFHLNTKSFRERARLFGSKTQVRGCGYLLCPCKGYDLSRG